MQTGGGISGGGGGGGEEGLGIRNARAGVLERVRVMVGVIEEKKVEV